MTNKDVNESTTSHHSIAKSERKVLEINQDGTVAKKKDEAAEKEKIKSILNWEFNKVPL